MLYYDRIEFSEGIDLNKAIASRECDICHYWYFLNKGFKFSNKCLEKMPWFISDFYKP